MQFSPRLHQSGLPVWQRSRDQLDRVDTKNSDCVLIVRVKMSNMMRGTSFCIHTNDDAIEPAQFRHKSIVPPRLTPSVANAA
jgi:hypothetical protein